MVADSKCERVNNILIRFRIIISKPAVCHEKICFIYNCFILLLRMYYFNISRRINCHFCFGWNLHTGRRNTWYKFKSTRKGRKILFLKKKNLPRAVGWMTKYHDHWNFKFRKLKKVTRCFHDVDFKIVFFFFIRLHLKGVQISMLV